MKIREGQRSADVVPAPTIARTRTDRPEGEARPDSYRGDGTTRIAAAPGPSISAPIRSALEQYETGRIPDALATLTALSADTSKPAADRADAAAWAGLIIRRDRPSSAGVWLDRATELAPASSLAAWLKTELLLDRAQVREALELTAALIEERPKDPLAFRARTSALLADAKPEEALAAAERALELAPDREWAARHRLFLGVGYGAAFANKPKRLVAALEESLALTPNDFLAHSLLSDFVAPPSFTGAHRTRIEAKFERANRRYQAGDYEAVKKIALEILDIEPKDGLAHALFGIAVKAQQKAELPLLSAIDGEAKRKTMIASFTQLTAQATVKGRPGRPSDLFPDWHALNDLQRATVAASVLPFGNMVARAIEAKAVYRLALPGTSCADASIDPGANLSESIGAGRYLYAVRGRARLDDKWVVSGVEEIDRAARGDYNTITHEFAHLVHGLMIDLNARREREEPLSKTEQAFAFASMEIEALFRQARSGRSGEQLVDSYAGSNLYEYFAQSLMSHLALSSEGMMTREKLEARNPAFSKFAARLDKLFAEL